MSTPQKKILFSSRAFPEKYKATLEEHDLKIITAPESMSETELIEALQGVSAHILFGSEKFNKNVLSSAPLLKAVAFFGTGYSSYIDVETASSMGIAVTNAPGANARSVAEFTLALILDAVKRTSELSRRVKSGLWTKDMTYDLYGRTLGIIGMGAVGSILAGIAANGLGMRVIYTSRQAKSDIERRTGAVKVELEELLEQSDIVSLHASETEETINLLDSTRLSRMKNGAVLINTARASLVEPHALKSKLDDGSLACAAFDCYYQEPAPAPQDDKFGLVGHSAFKLTPHASFLSEGAFENTTSVCLENIIAVLSDKEPANLVNPGYEKNRR